MVVALSIAPGLGRPDDTLFSWLVLNTATPIQKALHIVVYAVLAVLWMWTLHSVESRATRAILAFAATAGMGAVLEWHQTRVPGRYGTIADVILNVIGVIVGLVLAVLLF